MRRRGIELQGEGFLLHGKGSIQGHADMQDCACGMKKDAGVPYIAQGIAPHTIPAQQKSQAVPVLVVSQPPHVGMYQFKVLYLLLGLFVQDEAEFAERSNGQEGAVFLRACHIMVFIVGHQGMGDASAEERQELFRTCMPLAHHGFSTVRAVGHLFLLARTCADDNGQELWRALASLAHLDMAEFRTALSDLLFDFLGIRMTMAALDTSYRMVDGPEGLKEASCPVTKLISTGGVRRRTMGNMRALRRGALWPSKTSDPTNRAAPKKGKNRSPSNTKSPPGASGSSDPRSVVTVGENES